jgi:hypothetical protein
MSLIDEFISRMEGLGYCSASYILANAFASTCDKYFSVNFYEASYRLDGGNKKLPAEFIFIDKRAGYSRQKQMAVFRWLEANSYFDGEE